MRRRALAAASQALAASAAGGQWAAIGFGRRRVHAEPVADGAAPSPSPSPAVKDAGRPTPAATATTAAPRVDSAKRAKRKEPRATGRGESGVAVATDRADGVRAVGPPMPPPRTVLDYPEAYQTFRDVTPLSAVRATYAALGSGEKSEDVLRVGGRVTSMRDMGRILFLTIRADGQQLQVVRQADDSFTKADLKKLRDSLRVGDIIGAVGHPGRTLKGELSLYAENLHVLAPYVCADQQICPDLRGFTHVHDADVKYRYRFVDMMTDPAVQTHFRRRHTATRALRNFLDSRDFVEVETPVLHQVASGANARPFVTYHNGNDTDLYLRVAPELHLKQCVVGGMDRVYEIGRVFRNEDADRSHNPEFTSCELYAAYHSYEDLMPLTEDILRTMATAAVGTTVVTVNSCVSGEPVALDLSQPFRRVSVYDEIQRVAGVELPPPPELNTPRGLAYISAIMLRYGVPLPPVRTAAKMFDKLIDYFITDRVVEPTFVTDHPLFMSPLAKEHGNRPGLSERFELFINGTEYCNAYSELNDPQEQYYRFQQQLIDKQTGDDEAMALDETFLKALQIGLPPTAGWGMGLDRVMMLLNSSATIRDEIIFPLLRQDTHSHDAKRRRKTASSFGFSYQTTLFCLTALESEMVKQRAPSKTTEQVRELRRCIIAQGTHGSRSVDLARAGSGGELALSGWKLEAVMAMLSMICGRSSN